MVYLLQLPFVHCHRSRQPLESHVRAQAHRPCAARAAVLTSLVAFDSFVRHRSMSLAVPPAPLRPSALVPAVLVDHSRF